MEYSLIDSNMISYTPNDIKKSLLKIEGICEECAKKV